VKARLAVAVALLGAPMLMASPVHADPTTQLNGYQIVAQANVIQATEDFPTAPAHPIVEFELGYSEANIDSSRAHALAATVWPGALAGNAGSLLGVLGYPSINQLNDPVRAEAPSSAGQLHQSLTAGTAAMDAIVDPAGPSATSRSTLGTVSAGLLTLGAASSQSSSKLDPATGIVTSDAFSFASGIDIGGVIKIGSLTSTAHGKSANGIIDRNTLTGSTVFQDMTIANQHVYVDATGIHAGPAPNPGTGPLSAINQALKNAGMTLYFSSGQTVEQAGFSYYFPASVLLYWVPPGNSHGDAFTFDLGGAAVSMNITSSGLTVPTLAPSVSTPPTVVPGPVFASQQFPTPTNTSAPQKLAVPAPVLNPSSSTPEALPRRAQLAVATPHGLGVGWLVLLVLAGLVGAAALPRIPALLRAAGPTCDGEHPWPRSPDRRT
jgi:hypothetical protein